MNSNTPIWNVPKSDYVEALIGRQPMRVVLIDTKGILVTLRVEPGRNVDVNGVMRRNPNYFTVISDNADKPKAYRNAEWANIIQRISKERVALGHLAAVRAAITNNKPLTGRVLLDFT